MTSQPSRLTDELYGAATSAKSRKLVLVDGALHADMLLQPATPTKSQVETEILAFLDALWPRREPGVTVTGTTNQPESDAIRDDGAVRTG
jgi:hypothetical protein